MSDKTGTCQGCNKSFTLQKGRIPIHFRNGTRKQCTASNYWARIFDFPAPEKRDYTGIPKGR